MQRNRRTKKSSPPAPAPPPAPRLGITELLDQGIAFEIRGLKQLVEMKVRGAAEEMQKIAAKEKDGRLETYDLNAIESDLQNLRTALTKLEALRTWREEIDKHKAPQTAPPPEAPVTPDSPIVGA